MERFWSPDMKKVPEPKFDLEMELEPNRLSSDLRANFDSVRHVLKEADQKMRLSMILPLILANVDFLKQMVHGTEFDGCIAMVEKFLEFHNQKMKDEEEEYEEVKRLGSEELALYETKKKEKRPRDVIYLNTVPQEMIDLVEYFFKYMDVVEMFPMFVAKLPESDITLLEIFQNLENLALGNIEKSAVFKLDSEVLTQEMFRYNLQLKTIVLPLKKNIRRTMFRRTVETVVKIRHMKKVAHSMAVKEYASRTHLAYIRDDAMKKMEQDKFDTKRVVVRLTEDLEQVKLKLTKTLNQNSKRIIDIRQELNKVIATYENLRKKRDKTMLAKYNETERTKEIQAYEQRITDEFNNEYNRMRERHYQIVEVYFIRKLTTFWENLMVRKIEYWVCSVWKKMAALQAAPPEDAENDE